MKRTATLLLFLGSAASLYAKETGTNAVKPFPYFNNQQQNNSLPSEHRRLVGTATYMHNGSTFVPKDSVAYDYTGGRGSIVDIYNKNDDGVLYDQSISYIYAQGSYVPKLRRNITYNGGKITRLDLDIWKASANDFKDSIYYTFTYQDALVKAAYLYNISNPNFTNTIPYYNDISNGKVFYMHSPGYKIVFLYDNDHLSTVYDYTGPDIDPQYKDKNIYTYDAYGRLHTDVHFAYNTTSNLWTEKDRTTYYYNGSSAEISEVTREKWEANAWVKDQKTLYTYNNDHDLVVEETLIWNNSSSGYDKKAKLEWTYENADHPAVLMSYTWNGSNWINGSNDYKVHFHYKDYIPSGMDRAEAGMDVALYPNPAVENLNVAFEWDDSQEFSVMILDMQGRVMHSWNEPAVKRYRKEIALKELSSGHYFIAVRGRNGDQLTRQFAVTR